MANRWASRLAAEKRGQQGESVRQGSGRAVEGERRSGPRPDDSGQRTRSPELTGLLAEGQQGPWGHRARRCPEGWAARALGVRDAPVGGAESRGGQNPQEGGLKALSMWQPLQPRGVGGACAGGDRGCPRAVDALGHSLV